LKKYILCIGEGLVIEAENRNAAIELIDNNKKCQKKVFNKYFTYWQIRNSMSLYSPARQSEYPNAVTINQGIS